MMSVASPIVLLAGAADPVGQRLARTILDAGGRVAAAVTRSWQVDKLRQQLCPDGKDCDRLLAGVVAPRDAEAAAGFVKGAKDALGDLSHFVGASVMLRDKTLGREPAGDLEQLMDANLHCNATLARAVLPAMRKRKSGGLAFVTAPTETAGLSVTCRASLAATAEFAAGLASDVADVGLRVETIAAAFADGDSEASEQKLCEAIWASIADGS